MIEIIDKDLLGRIARFRTKTGTIETPAFLPVVHPTKELIPPRKICEEYNCSVLITNAYLLMKAEQEGKIHNLLDFPGSIMTDSGAYQLLVYGEVDVTPEQIIRFQERIQSDIAVILDVPTGGKASYEKAKETVDVTLRRAKESMKYRERKDILWAGPIQGGTYSDLVAYSAAATSKLDFSIFAIGSPTQLMEQYQFGKLVDLVISAKQHLPTDKPVHLFGAGHPLIFPLIVAMGCDMFDSAAYAIFARHDRLLTPEGTYRLDELEHQFCFCPVCNKYTPAEIRQLPKDERARILAEHNLYTCFQEISRIKQAIQEGRLWRLVESRLASHPSLIDAMNRLVLASDLIEEFSPVTKKKAIFISSKWSVYQPEIIRHKNRIISYQPPESTSNHLLILAAPQKRPFSSSSEFLQLTQVIKNIAPRFLEQLDILFVSPYFGPIPLELSGVYPFAQNEIPQTNLLQDPASLVELIIQYISKNSQYRNFIGVFPSTSFWKGFVRRCSRKVKEQKKNWQTIYTDFHSVTLTKSMKRALRL